MISLQSSPTQNHSTSTVELLERELALTREELDRTVQELEASNEELKSSNEELLSMNEELQSANEELEASQEAVQRAYGALQKSNNDLENLLAGNHVATLSRSADARLRSSEELYKFASRATREAIWDWDLVTNTVTWNEALVTGLEHDPSARSSQATWWYENIHPDDRDRVVQGIHAVIDDDGDLWQDEYRFRKGDGSYAYVLDRGFIKRDDDGRAVRMIGAMQDLTQKKVIEDELMAAKQAAETANHLKTQFLANMSHEIRTPVGIIMGFLELIKSSDATRGEVCDYMRIIERHSHQLLRLIDDILDLSKIEAGKITVEKTVFSLPELLSEFASSVEFHSREKGLRFNMVCENAMPSHVLSDPTRLRQILLNLATNAIKFTERGDVEVKARFDDGQLTVSVRDTGIGISANQAASLFMPFSQGDVSMTRKFGGTGLGLALSRRLAEALGGKLELESSVTEEGSVFTLKVPLLIADASDLEPADVRGLSHSPVPGNGELRGVKILLVEDAPDNRVLIGMFLNRAGAEITYAVDGAEGVAKALAGHFNIVLMDIQMPNLDGYQAMRLLRQQSYKVPIIALTAHAMAEEKQRCIDAGASFHLSKPIDHRRLIKAISLFAIGK